MNAKDKITKENKLLEVYGTLLTKKQLDIMKDKFEYDLSLQEIADNYNISRSAVLDTINKGCKKLEEYENKLQFIKKKREVLSIISNETLKNKIKKIL